MLCLLADSLLLCESLQHLSSSPVSLPIVQPLPPPPIHLSIVSVGDPHTHLNHTSDHHNAATSHSQRSLHLDSPSLHLRSPSTASRSPGNLHASASSAQITGWIDEGLNEKAYIIPGLGDFGERRCVFSSTLLDSSLPRATSYLFDLALAPHVAQRIYAPVSIHLFLAYLSERELTASTGIASDRLLQRTDVCGTCLRAGWDLSCVKRRGRVRLGPAARLHPTLAAEHPSTSRPAVPDFCAYQPRIFRPLGVV